MSVSAEERHEKYQVLYESLLKTFDIIFESSRTLITLLEQRSIVESVRPVDIVNKIQQTFSTCEEKTPTRL